MAPRDSKDASETNGDDHPTEKRKGKAKISRTSSTESFPDLTPEGVDQALVALREMSRILYFANTYHDKIRIVKDIHGLHIDQQERNEELESMLDKLTFRKDREVERLQAENEAYRTDTDQLEREREELELEQATMEDTRQAMQLDMERQKEKGINEAKQEFSDKFKTRAKQMKEELGKQIKALERDKDGSKEALKELEAKNAQAQNDLQQQKESFELDKRSCQSYIIRLESELRCMNAASIVSPQTPEFYIDGFHQLWELIRDVAVNGFQLLTEDTKLVDSDEVRNQLFSASTIFRYHPLLSETPVSIFLRGCAIQDFLSTKFISMIRRQYFVAQRVAVKLESGAHPMDSILDTISNVPAANSSQELAWRLMTVDKLDRLGSGNPSGLATVVTEPDQDIMMREIWDQLLHFQSPPDQQLDAKLSEVASIATRLWSAIRKDSCQIDFDYDPSIGDRQEWVFVDDMVTSSAKVANPTTDIPVAQLPSKPLVLFPRITGSFGSDGSDPRILHTGSALSHNSLAFREGLEEIERIDSATRELIRRLRRGSSAQSLPAAAKYQGSWTTLPNRQN